MGKYTRGQKKLSNIKKQRQEYPLLSKQIIEVADIILEVLDSRFIKETRIPELERLAKDKNKKIIYVFNKSDLVEKNKAPSYLRPSVNVSASKRKGIRELRDLIKKLANQITKESGKMIRQGNIIETQDTSILVGIIGYPNTGKSSLINSLIGKSSAGTGSDAGFTKNIQKLKLSSDIFLLDTPGVIPKKEYSSSDSDAISKHTKLGGRSYSQVKEPEIIVHNLMKEHSKQIEAFYKINAKGNAETLIEELGRQKGFMKKGGIVNEDKTSRLILKDWQEGMIKLK